MKKLQKHLKTTLLFATMLLLVSCDRTSSPEGRMGIKVEDLQQQMLDTMQQHHRALLDSIGQLRQEITTLKAAKP